MSGSWAGEDSPGEVRVWGLEELDLQQTLAQPADSDVYALVAPAIRIHLLRLRAAPTRAGR